MTYEGITPGIPDLPPDYQIPTEDQLKGLKIEVIVLICVYTVALGFVFHNIIRYLWFQRKFRVFQISIFYVLSLMVITFRILQYSGSIKLYNSIDEFLYEDGLVKILFKNFQPEVSLVRQIGLMQIGSDYSKYALAFYQLASMCELAIVIRFSVYHMIKKEEFDNFDTEESIVEQQKG